MTESASAVVIREHIGAAIEWRIKRARHLLIVHLGGVMDSLETQLDGICTSIGPANPGEFWFVPAGSDYLGTAAGGEIHYAEVEIGTALLPEIDLRPGVPAGTADPVLARLAVGLADDGGDDAVAAIAEQLGDWFRFGKEARRATPLSPSTVRMLRRYIHEQLDQPIALSTLAELAGLSVNALLRRFVLSFGATPAQFIIQERLRRARWLLERSSLDITAIAMRTGFSSHAHLTSTFSQRLGRSPGAWRRSANGGVCHGSQETPLPGASRARS